MQAFFMLVFKILRYIVPPCGTIMEPQHSRYVLNSGKGNIPFLFIVMFNNIDNHHQTNNSSLMATLIHDTDRMSSLEIAELTGKRHDAILRDIRNLLKQGVSHHNFVETSYKQPQPRGGYKELPCFELTKKGCLILASGYDAVLREKIIDRWEQLELEKRKPQTPPNLPRSPESPRIIGRGKATAGTGEEATRTAKRQTPAKSSLCRRSLRHRRQGRHRNVRQDPKARIRAKYPIRQAKESGRILRQPQRTQTEVY